MIKMYLTNYNYVKMKKNFLVPKDKILNKLFIVFLFSLL